MAGEVSKENGKKGGRPKGTNAIKAEAIKGVYIEMAQVYARPIASVLGEKALAGDIQAAKEFNDRSLGKAQQSFEVNGEIKAKIILVDE